MHYFGHLSGKYSKKINVVICESYEFDHRGPGRLFIDEYETKRTKNPAKFASQIKVFKFRITFFFPSRRSVQDEESELLS